MGEEEKPEWAAITERFFSVSGINLSIPDSALKHDFHSDLIKSQTLFNVHRIDRGIVSCSFTVHPSLANAYNTLHGGVVGAVAEMVAVACAKTVAKGFADFFLGEVSTSYLSAVRIEEVVEVEGRVLRQGRTVVVSIVEFRVKETKKLVYVSRVTVYNMPLASL
ncbi:hypothetical protein QJS04_geneDACA010720 [Acorus gramineus]|uniref:HotDog ACOT-type domain-containing protein n=1 Tax=Acorus gramineus TaxID=55184 RepID=A0AAV9B8S2_ACOGR|nr:hypothetical protein QJS04_geneDACA010720 [Acorus gramineus]